MAKIFQQNGQSVYEENGKTISATTGQEVSPTQNASMGIATAPTVINSNTLSGGSTPAFQPVQPSVVNTNYAPPVLSNIPAPTAVMTPLEQQIQDLIKSTTQNNTDLAGQANYRNEQNATQDITGKTQIINDLVSQFNNSVRKAQDIPNQDQLNATGRGITAAGLAPITAAQVRINSIQQNILASQIETAKGNLSYAQQLVTDAVNAKYAPLEAERDAKIKNLELLLQSPQLTVEKKNRADAQLAYQTAQKEQEAQAKSDMADQLNLVNTAIQNGLTDTRVIQQIQNAKTLAEAQQIAAPYMQKAVTSKIIGSASTGYYQVDNNGNLTPLTPGSGNSPAETKPISILDVQRYNELYPEAGVVAGDTETQANAKIAASNTPEAKLKTKITGFQTSGAPYDQVVNDINTSTTIKDKSTALKVAKDVYGVSDTTNAPSKIENAIKELSTSGRLNNQDIRSELSKAGYSAKEIANSSVGGIISKIGAYLFGESI